MTYRTDFETTFKLDAKGRVNADIIEVERFAQKYKILIERVTNQFVEPLDMFNCVDFRRRIDKLYALGNRVLSVSE